MKMKYVRHKGEWFEVLEDHIGLEDSGWWIRVRKATPPHVEGLIYHENPFTSADWLEVHTDEEIVG